MPTSALLDQEPIMPKSAHREVCNGTLETVSHETEKTIPQIALNWLLQRPTVSTLIIGARNEEQLRQNIGAVGWKLTEGQIKRLDDASARSPAYPYWHQRGDFPERNPPPV
jgi:aryl-alcohol dehydrogenase-like predicted oxidoreductase